MFENIPSLQLGDLRVPLAIVQGGMGVGISLSGLASAVAEAGGIGTIAAVGIGMPEPDFLSAPHQAHRRRLTKEIQIAKERTRGIIGVNIMMALTDSHELIETACAAGADVLFMGAGLPLAIPEAVADRSRVHAPKIVPIVSSGRAADLICRSWLKRHGRLPDGFVLEGPLAGGHLGFSPEEISDPGHCLENLLAETLKAIAPYEAAAGVRVPVITAGGIFSGADIQKFLRLGASGVQMGTRFVATHECDASVEFKNTYVRAKESDVIIVKSPLGLPGRAIQTSLQKNVECGNGKPVRCQWRCLKTCNPAKTPYCIADALVNAKRGNIDNGLVFCGKNVSRVDRILSVNELIGNLRDEFAEASRH